MWAFEKIADGLFLRHGSAAPSDASAAASKLPRILLKKSGSNDIFDAHGKPLGSDEQQQATTWRSHHAFSGRCAIVDVAPLAEHAGPQHVEQQQHQASEETPQSLLWVQHTWQAYRLWDAQLKLQATAAEEPSFLVSVAPYYYPYNGGKEYNSDAAFQSSEAGTSARDIDLLTPSVEERVMYDRRLLETPLIWEEPYTLSVECSPRGVFLWSDQWSLYGKKIADHCLIKRDSGARISTSAPNDNGGKVEYEGAVRLQWSIENTPVDQTGSTTATLTVATAVPEMPGGDDHHCGEATSPQEGLRWMMVAELPLPLQNLSARAVFVPHVTLMESGDSAELF